MKVVAWRKLASTLYLQAWVGLVLTGGLVVAMGLVQNKLPASVTRPSERAGSSRPPHDAATPAAAATPVYYRPLVDAAYAPIAQVTLVARPAHYRPLVDAAYAPIAQVTPAARPAHYRPLAGSGYAPIALVTPLLPVTVTPLPYIMHTAQKDETMFSVAAQYGVTAEALLAINKVKDATYLESGQAVLIPSSDHSFQVKIVRHKAEAGETLLSIASKYGSSVVTLQAANPQLGSRSLVPGEAIAVPLVLPDPRPAVPAQGIATPVYHTVQTGEVPLKIAAKYDIPVKILLAANQISDPLRLRVGQRLMIPAHLGLSQAETVAPKPEPDQAALSVGETVAIPVILGPQPARSAVVSIPFSPIPAPPALPVLQTHMVAAVNAERAAAGLPPCRPDEALDAVALGHAQDMVVRDFVAHVNPDGQSPRDRLEASGIERLKRVGENIQLNTWPAEHTVRAAIDWFMDSPPHRLNILDPHYTHLGVAAVPDNSGWYYIFVLEFAEK